jgi:phosphate transport system substrate-binding protein
MSKSPNSSSIVNVLITVGLLAGGALWFIKGNPFDGTGIQSPISGSNQASSPDSNAVATFPPTTVLDTTQVRIDGATSMVTINKNLKTAFENKFPGAQILTKSNGSEPGLKALQAGTVDLAAVSRPLTPQEEAQGLKSVVVAKDPLALVVGIDNSVSNNLTSEQLVGIFNGSIDNWDQLGGRSGKIRIVNRPAASGTRQVFQDLVLKGAAFGTSANFMTLPRDATTPLLQALGADGIGYATYAQVAAQTTVRVLSVGGISPAQSEYPYTRSLLYVYKNPPSPTVKAALGFALSPEGQKAIKSGQ